MKDTPKRGEVYWTNLDSTSGKEIKKTRPCLVVSINEANKSELIIAVPITSNVERVIPKIEIEINLNGKKGKILTRQLRCIDRTERLGKKIGILSAREMQEVDEALKLILGLG